MSSHLYQYLRYPEALLQLNLTPQFVSYLPPSSQSHSKAGVEFSETWGRLPWLTYADLLWPEGDLQGGCGVAEAMRCCRRRGGEALVQEGVARRVAIGAQKTTEINITTLQAMVSGILLVLGLRTRM